jgi:hypothetical protein
MIFIFSPGPQPNAPFIILAFSRHQGRKRGVRKYQFQVEFPSARFMSFLLFRRKKWAHFELRHVAAELKLMQSSRTINSPGDTLFCGTRCLLIRPLCTWTHFGPASAATMSANAPHRSTPPLPRGPPDQCI